MHTGYRNQLHLTQIEAFAEWAETQGYKRELHSGDYEVLRLRRGTESPIFLWRRIKGDHATSDKYSQPLVSRWFKAARTNQKTSAETQAQSAGGRQ